MRRWLYRAILLVAVAALAAGLGLRWLRDQVERPYSAHGAAAVDVQVERGMSARRVAALLQEAGVVENDRVLSWWLWWTDKAGSIHAGEYRFSEPRSVQQVADILTEGRVLLRPVTIPEGATRWQVAELIAAAGFGSYEEAFAATADASLVADLDPLADTLEGYLYPETYLAPATDGPRELVAAMVRRFRSLWTPELRARAAELGMSLREVVVLASLIEAETPAAQERPLVSAVFHNRLARGMRLQTDPTVLYAMKLAGREDRTIRRSDLARDSPYNTYVVAGLPPGPVGNPREASVAAALYPAEVDFLYFVSRNDGTHVFTRTLAEHNQMVNRYQRVP